MKLLLGIVIGAGLFIGGSVFAQSTALQKVEETQIDSYFLLTKVYDQNNKVVCYTLTGGPSGAGVSCLKN